MEFAWPTHSLDSWPCNKQSLQLFHLKFFELVSVLTFTPPPPPQKTTSLCIDSNLQSERLNEICQATSKAIFFQRTCAYFRKPGFVPLLRQIFSPILQGGDNNNTKSFHSFHERTLACLSVTCRLAQFYAKGSFSPVVNKGAGVV